MNNWSQIPSDETINKTVAALIANGITAEVVQTGEEAKQKVLALIPKNAEIMTMSSVTLETIGLTKAINESGDYDAVKAKLLKMDRQTQSEEMQKMGAAPSWSVGSVNAVTMTGEVMIASNTGSQLPAYVYGSAHVIWIVGAQKIVNNLDEAHRRVYEYVFPLESERLKKLHGVGSFVSKLLLINREIRPNRITMILVKEKLGY